MAIDEYTSIMGRISLPKELRELPHIQKIINSYKLEHPAQSADFVYVKTLFARLNEYEVLHNGKPYNRSSWKNLLYKFTNAIGLTNKNLEYAEFDITNIKDWDYYSSLDNDAISFKRNEKEYDVKYNLERPMFTFRVSERITAVRMADSGIPKTVESATNIIEEALGIKNYKLTLYVKNVKVDGLDCTIKFNFNVIGYKTNDVPIEDDITQLGLSKIINYFSAIKNCATIETIGIIESGEDTDEQKSYPTIREKYIPSIEELVMFSDYALNMYNIDLKEFFEEKKKKAEIKELYQKYVKSQEENYVDPSTIFSKKEDEPKVKAVKTKVRKNTEETKEDVKKEEETKEEKPLIKSKTVKVKKVVEKTETEKEETHQKKEVTKADKKTPKKKDEDKTKKETKKKPTAVKYGTSLIKTKKDENKKEVKKPTKTTTVTKKRKKTDK